MGNSGWSNDIPNPLIVGGNGQTGQIILLGPDGAVAGTLDGDHGLVFVGSGTVAAPELQITPQSDVVWANPGGTSPNVISVSGTSMFFIAGTDAGDHQGAALAIASEVDGVNAPGLQVFEWIYGNDQTGGGSPVPSVESWHTLAVLPPATPNAGDPLQVRSLPTGKVQIQGQVGNVTTAATIANLPTGYAPPKDIRIPVVAQNSAGSTFGTVTLNVTTAGVVRALAPPSGLTVMHFDGAEYSLLT